MSSVASDLALGQQLHPNMKEVTRIGTEPATTAIAILHPFFSCLGTGGHYRGEFISPEVSFV